MKMANDIARLEIDDTPLDILVMGDDGKRYRPRVRTAIDPYTRMIVGVDVSTDQDDIKCLKTLLQNAGELSEPISVKEAADHMKNT
jgi:hypothetical protein